MAVTSSVFWNKLSISELLLCLETSPLSGSPPERARWVRGREGARRDELAGCRDSAPQWAVAT